RAPAQGRRVRARVAAELDDARLAELRQVVMRRRLREAEMLRQLDGARALHGEVGHHAPALLVRERARDYECAADPRLLRVGGLGLGGVADDPRVVVLAEEEPRGG